MPRDEYQVLYLGTPVNVGPFFTLRGAQRYINGGVELAGNDRGDYRIQVRTVTETDWEDIG